MAQEYTVEQLNHGRKVWDFMRWDYWAFGISGFLLILSIVIMGVKGFNWGLDFTGGTVIEITLEKPVDMDQMRESLQKAGFEEPLLQNFGSSRDIMVRMPPVHDANGSQELGSKVVTVINESTSQNARQLSVLSLSARASVLTWRRPAPWRCLWRWSRS